MLERLSWKRLLSELALASLPALIIGLIFGYLPWLLLISALAVLLWHFHNLMRLSHWLWVDRTMTPPTGQASWEPLFYGLYQMQLRNRRRRRELGNLIKRFRSGAETLPDAVVLTTEEGTIFWCNGLALQTMQEQTRRMDSLVRQLLTLSRIEAAPAIDMKETVDVPMMLHLLQREAETLSSGRHEIHFHTDPHLKVLGDDDQLRSAISNLVYNAVNHTPEGTRIDISWLRNRQGAQFKVCDNGPGIPAEHLPRLTERFYRVDKARSRATGGSGLGLAIVKHALSHHNARLEITSIPDKETCFTFTLPSRLIVSAGLQENAVH